MKLVLFAYLRGRTSCRLIEREACENLYARWLTQEQVPSYRTIARFIVSNKADELIQSSFDSMYTFLTDHNLIDESVFIDGTKILANANKYSFVWKKNIIRFDELNREKAIALIEEIKAVERAAFADSLPLDYEELDLVVAKLEERVDELMQRLKQRRKSRRTRQSRPAGRRSPACTKRKQFVINGTNTRQLRRPSGPAIASRRPTTMQPSCV